jgi:hypothetical protein
MKFLELFKEFLLFLIERKKYWLMPVLLFIFIFGSILFFSQGTVFAPFIYTIF